MSATITSAARVVKEGQLRNAGNSEVLNVRVAVDRGWGNNKATDFFNLSIWGKQGAALAPILTRGTFIVFSGEFSTREYEQNGEKRIALECRCDRVDLGPRAATADDDRRAAGTGLTQTNGRQSAGGAAAVTEDDEIPF